MVQKAAIMSFYNRRSVLVTGGTGLVGLHLMEEMLSRGAQVHAAVCNRPLPRFSGQIGIVRGDLTELRDCIEAMESMEYTFHLVALVEGVAKTRCTSPRSYERSLSFRPG